MRMSERRSAWTVFDGFCCVAGKPTDSQAFPRNLAPDLWVIDFLMHTFGHLVRPVMASVRAEASTYPRITRLRVTYAGVPEILKARASCCASAS